MIVNLLKHFLTLLFVKLPVQVAGIPILAVVLLFGPRDKEYLPSAFRWWDNHERYFDGNKSDDGLSGPDYIRNKWSDPTGWLARFNWLALRNPANYFQHRVLGRTANVFLERVKVKGDLKVGTHDWNTRGYYYQEVLNGHEKLWELYIVQPIYKKWHFRFRAGWKIGGYFSKRDPGDSLQWVFAITPLKKLD
jgi:hypothetical protein